MQRPLMSTLLIELPDEVLSGVMAHLDPSTRRNCAQIAKAMTSSMVRTMPTTATVDVGQGTVCKSLQFIVGTVREARPLDFTLHVTDRTVHKHHLVRHFETFAAPLFQSCLPQPCLSVHNLRIENLVVNNSFVEAALKLPDLHTVHLVRCTLALDGMTPPVVAAPHVTCLILQDVTCVIRRRCSLYSLLQQLPNLTSLEIHDARSFAHHFDLMVDRGDFIEYDMHTPLHLWRSCEFMSALKRAKMGPKLTHLRLPGDCKYLTEGLDLGGLVSICMDSCFLYTQLFEDLQQLAKLKRVHVKDLHMTCDLSAHRWVDRPCKYCLLYSTWCARPSE